MRQQAAKNTLTSSVCPDGILGLLAEEAESALGNNLHLARWSASERWKCSFFDIASNLFHAWPDIMDGRLELTGRYAELMRPVDATSASSLTSISPAAVPCFACSVVIVALLELLGHAGRK